MSYEHYDGFFMLEPESAPLILDTKTIRDEAHHHTEEQLQAMARIPLRGVEIATTADGPCESCDQLPPDLLFPNCKCYE